MNKDAKILIVGHDEVIDRSLFLKLREDGFTNVVSTVEEGLDTTIQSSVYEFFQNNRPEYVFLSSVRSGGIEVNRRSPAEFFYQNCESQNNILYASNKFGVKKLLFIAASCIYPKDCSQPMKEESFLTGEIEPTSAGYAVAKIAGVQFCKALRQENNFNAIVMVPATVYGDESSLNQQSSHVIGSLISKFTEAVKNNESDVVIWGSGIPRREFLYSDDFVDACKFLMDQYDEEGIINVGYGEDIAIKDLAELIAQKTGFRGDIVLDSSKPDGAKQKLLDSTRILQKGWKAKVSLDVGIESVVKKVSLIF